MKHVSLCRVLCAVICLLALIAGPAHARSADNTPAKPAVAASKKKDGAIQSKTKSSDAQKSARAADNKDKNAPKQLAKSKSEQQSGKKKDDSLKGQKSSSKKVAQAGKNQKTDKKRSSKRGNRIDPRAAVPDSVELPQSGTASWVGSRFHGKPVANGERYDLHSFTAAHLFAPFNSILRVTEIDSGRSTLVRVNDRGPYIRGRIIDLSMGAAQYLGYAGKGLTNVRVELAGNDEDPELRYYIQMQPGDADESPKTAPVEGFGPFDRFDDAASLFADLHKDYPQARLVAVREKS